MKDFIEQEKSRIQGLFEEFNARGSWMRMADGHGEPMRFGLIDSYIVTRVAPHLDTLFRYDIQFDASWCLDCNLLCGNKAHVYIHVCRGLNIQRLIAFLTVVYTYGNRSSNLKNFLVFRHGYSSIGASNNILPCRCVGSNVSTQMS